MPRRTRLAICVTELHRDFLFLAEILFDLRVPIWKRYRTWSRMNELQVRLSQIAPSERTATPR